MNIKLNNSKNENHLVLPYFISILAFYGWKKCMGDFWHFWGPKPKLDYFKVSWNPGALQHFRAGL